MKRFILCLVLGAGLLSCSESLTTRTAAGLAGTYDLVPAGRYLFVTSSDRDELRVLDLEATPRDFVRAPNPLEALSIPVLDRPSNLARDVVFAVELVQDKEGEGAQELSRELVQDAEAPYVYARSFGSREISIVSTNDLTVQPEDPVRFQERHRLRAEGLVTTFAARGPVRERVRTPASGDTLLRDAVSASFTQSVLYYAVQTGMDAKLYRVALPVPSELTPETQLTPVALDLDLTGRTVTALLVLPPPAGQPGQESLVVATRGTAGTGGETFRVEVNNTQVTRGATYEFGAPVRLLATHLRAQTAEDEWQECTFDRKELNDTAAPPAPLAAGQYVFGVLDESSCGGQPACSGVVAVESVTGARARDAVGLPMLNISVGQALPTGLTLAENVDVNLPCQIQDEPTRVVPIVRRPLVGIVPASNGVITLFDAVRMRPFDLDPVEKTEFTALLVDSAGKTRNINAELVTRSVSAELVEGVTQNDTYRFLYQLAVPGLASVERTEVDCPPNTQGRCFAVDAAAATRVELNDVVVLRGDSGTCKDTNGNEVDLVISAKVEAANQPTILVTTLNPELPAACVDMPRIIVRAVGAHPFVVTSDNKGYLGRVALGQPVEVAGSYYYQPSPQLEPAPKDVRITLNALPADQPPLQRGDQYIVTTLSHFLPYVFSADVGSVSAGLAAYRLPGPVVYSRVGGTDFAYIAYPSADGILQIALETITDNAANTTGLVTFE